MVRKTEREQLDRLTVKTLDQVFIARAKEGLNCSLFEAQALTDLVKEVYFPWLSRPDAIQAGQLILTAVSADEPGHKRLSRCKMVPVVLTLYAGKQDYEYRVAQKEKQGITTLRRQQIVRMAQEALDQGALLTAENSAFRIFNCGLRIISRDLEALSKQGITVPLRSQQRDIGRAITHRVQAVELYLKRYTFTQISQRIRHSLSSIANYVVTFILVVAHTRDGHSVDDIAFLMQISPSLVQAYQELYKQYDTPEYQERIEEIVATVKARGFRPSQLEHESEPSEAEKGGRGDEQVQRTLLRDPISPSGGQIAAANALQLHQTRVSTPGWLLGRLDVRRQAAGDRRLVPFLPRQVEARTSGLASRRCR